MNSSLPATRRSWNRAVSVEVITAPAAAAASIPTCQFSLAPAHDCIFDKVHMVPRVKELDHRLEHADMGLHAGDDNLLPAEGFELALEKGPLRSN